MNAPLVISDGGSGQVVGRSREGGMNGADSRHRESALPATVSLWCLRFFGPAACAGAAIALTAPFAFVRLLGLVALVASVLAFALHVYLLRHDHPAEWIARRSAWYGRVEQMRSRLNALVASSHPVSAAAVAAPFKPRLVTPATAQEF